MPNGGQSICVSADVDSNGRVYPSTAVAAEPTTECGLAADAFVSWILIPRSVGAMADDMIRIATSSSSPARDVSGELDHELERWRPSRHAGNPERVEV